MLKPFFSQKARIEAGCDEVGRGCLAGPVVAAAAILPRDFEHPLVKDSKKLTEKQRHIAEAFIKEHAFSYAIAEVSPEEIDKINILNASYLAMHKAVDKLTMVPELLLIDGNRFSPYKKIAHECIIKGDNHFFSIAAASILAKNYRDHLMARLAEEFPAYGWRTNVGYPTPAHKAAIEQHGITPHHRKSFSLKKQQLSLFDEIVLK